MIDDKALCVFQKSETFSGDEFSLNQLFASICLTDSEVTQFYFPESARHSTSLALYAHCVVGPYLLLEFSNQNSARLKIHLFVYKISQTAYGLIWKEIELPPDSYLLSQKQFDSMFKIWALFLIVAWMNWIEKPISIAPQIYENEKILFLVEPRGIAKSLSVYVINFESKETFAQELFKFPIEENFRSAYLR